ncbi:MAG: Ig-like domain-containing protein, partial [Proteobacteria bacterium]|nr:Ig-like domain-containing protein [Pseudomonadota bacterium]
MIKTIFTLLIGCLYLTSPSAQNRAYEIYFDTDNDQATGCIVTHQDLADIVGIDSKLTITTDNETPSILMTSVYDCLDSDFIELPSTVTSSLGFNTGNNGEDVLESKLLFADIGISSVNSTKVSFATTHETAEDVVIEKSSGTPIIINNLDPIQIPGLGFIGFFLLALLIFIISKKRVTKTTTLMVYLFLISPLVWAFAIIIDGQTTDWERIEASALDPVGDTSNPGEYSDITSVYAVSQEGTIYLRMDIVDVENQSPTVNSTAATTLEDNQVTIQLTGQDPNNNSLTFAIEQSPTNGTLGQITQVNATTSEVIYTPTADFNGTDNFTFAASDGISNSTIATAEIIITAVNDAPSFVAGTDITIAEDSGLYNVMWTTSLYQGADNESSQQLNFKINTNSNPSLFNTQPQLDATGQLTFSTFSNTTGTTTLNINLLDDGGTINGGIDTSDNYDLNITITPINDPPAIISTPLLIIDTCGANYNYDVNAIDSDIGDVISYSLTTVFPGMSIDNVAGMLLWSAASLQVGTHTITVQATDLALASDTQSYDLVVEECNLPPEITSIPSQSVDEFTTYNYDVDAIDPNNFDVLDYSLFYSAVNTVIEPTTGLINSEIIPSINPQSIKAINTVCKLPSINNTRLSFEPKVKWAWGRRKSLSMPLVAPLIDNNGDGEINIGDDPVVLINSYTGSIDSAASWLVAIDGKTGNEIWEQETIFNGFNVQGSASSTPAIGDIDNDGIPDIIAFTRRGEVARFNNLVQTIWISAILNIRVLNYGLISLYDLDGDGISEILAYDTVLDANGNILWTAAFSALNPRSASFAVDTNDDGFLEVVISGNLYSYDGVLINSAAASSINNWILTSVGNFDSDDFPEFVMMNGSRSAPINIKLLDSDFSLISGFNVPGIGRGGPPVISDLDGNG